MKVTDYIVEFLIQKGVTDVFGYPGGMVTHLMDSFAKKEDKIKAHINYHEQASAFSACGYAQTSNMPGVAYATSGPGATNLITGICNAYFDSIPVLFITGQVNTFETKVDFPVRQKGFQETDITDMVKGCTKFCKRIENKDEVECYLNKSWMVATTGRPGPVLLDIPMDIQRSEIEIKGIIDKKSQEKTVHENWERIEPYIVQAKRPVLLIGAGIKTVNEENRIHQLAHQWGVPVVSSMLATDIFEEENESYYGFLGSYGTRVANFIVAKSDLVFCIGSRLDIRQVGAKRDNFAPKAQIIRCDIDAGEFAIKIRDNEIEIQDQISTILDELLENIYIKNRYTEWNNICRIIRQKLANESEPVPNRMIRLLSHKLPDNTVITTDVGQNQVWVAQSFAVKTNQKILFSGGHGAMGYSLPAAIGAYYGSQKPVISFNGDGGFQMNLQECEFVAREKIPILIVIINNYSLGMIRHFQEMYFQANYYQTVEGRGYTVPDFSKIAYAYGIQYSKIEDIQDVEEFYWDEKEPRIVEICFRNQTYVVPKLEFGKPNQDQEPLIDRDLYQYLMEL